MPGPLGRPLETVKPDVFEVQSDALQAPASQERCDTVGALMGDRDQHPCCGQIARGNTRAPAITAARTTTTGAGGGWTAIARRHTSTISSTPQA